MTPRRESLKYEATVGLPELEAAAILVLKHLASAPKRTKAPVVCLYGDLGSGKTAFVKKIGKILGIREKIVSPTFVIMKKYAVPKNKRKIFKLEEVVHVDAYRLSGHHEILKLDWPEILKKTKSAVFVEWPERVKKAVPKGALKIRLSYAHDKKRKIKIEEQ